VRTEQSDYVQRLVEQLGGVLRRLAERLGLGTPEAAREVAGEAEAARLELLGPLAGPIERVDAASAVGLVRDPRRVRLWIGFLRLEAAARRLDGAGAEAAALEARADALDAALPPAGGHDG
jgi:hypothetical protein